MVENDYGFWGCMMNVLIRLWIHTMVSDGYTYQAVNTHTLVFVTLTTRAHTMCQDRWIDCTAGKYVLTRFPQGSSVCIQVCTSILYIETCRILPQSFQVPHTIDNTTHTLVLRSRFPCTLTILFLIQQSWVMIVKKLVSQMKPYVLSGWFQVPWETSKLWKVMRSCSAQCKKKGRVWLFGDFWFITFMIYFCATRILLFTKTLGDEWHLPFNTTQLNTR